MRGHVILKSPLALGIQITSLVASSKVRDFSGLDVRGLVQHENLSEDRSKRDRVLQDMEMEDVVQGELYLGGDEKHYLGIVAYPNLQLLSLANEKATWASHLAATMSLNSAHRVLFLRAFTW